MCVIRVSYKSLGVRDHLQLNMATLVKKMSLPHKATINLPIDPWGWDLVNLLPLELLKHRLLCGMRTQFNNMNYLDSFLRFGTEPF